MPGPGTTARTRLNAMRLMEALGITARVIQPGETPETIVESVVKRLGLPTVRIATRQAMRLLGSHFVLGQTIEEALSRAGSHREFRYSFDMLGEGARTAEDAARYFDAYAKRFALQPRHSRWSCL